MAVDIFVGELLNLMVDVLNYSLQISVQTSQNAVKPKSVDVTFLF